MLNSSGPKTEAPQPPVFRFVPVATEERVVQKAYTRPVVPLTWSVLGPPESEHWRSFQASVVGSAIGIGGPKVAPPSAECATHMLCCATPLARLWNSM